MTPLPALAPALAGAAACLLATAGLRPVRRTIPYLGGVTLAAATTGAAAAGTMTALGSPDRRVSAVLLAAAAVALLGLIADVGALPLVTRLIVESVAAGGVVMCGVQVTLTGDWLDGPVSVMWIVALTNAYGLLDRLGGALAAVAAVTGAFLAVTALVLGDPLLAVLAAALAGACLGALPYGRARGRVRLGPSGSLFAGFVLTCTAAGLTAGRGSAVVASGLLLPALAAIVGAGAYAVHRPRRGARWPAGPARKAAPALCVVSAGTGTAGLAVALGWMPAGATAAVTAATAATVAALLVYARLRRDLVRARLRHDLTSARLRHDPIDARLRHDPIDARLRHDLVDADVRARPRRAWTSLWTPAGDDRPRGRVPHPRSAGNPPPPVVRRG
ncbi:hypothetical protein [Microbispora siamensis]|uniref:UDP-N-acetylmuramyl pentapeptide phosphotransferase/UDP-N-acetylglucosamine-1-phosphate transferase n=1 Tax=Microbispora siamensis TaxID=564413 RepID=A0ABQ4GGG2_9ACTN|nr:hypothetical protein [Microbispora siamensis]GIH60514.1 hypothetical protein Msi02_13310 [Microbispora siamensis]